VIVLHRLAHEAEPFHLNPDLILTVEATPDTVIALTTGARIVVAEPPEQVAEEVRAWRASILAARPQLAAVEGTRARADHPG
jgi:flagellar protein FlbD